MQLNKFNLLLLMMAAIPLSGCVGPEGESVFVPRRPDAPAIVFDSTEHDFGTVPAGSENTCTFAFINDGAKDLQIENLHASCGCTVASPTDRTIVPGNASELTVTFTAGTFPGVQKRKITVVTKLFVYN